MLQSGRAHYYYHLRAVQLIAGRKVLCDGEKIANINALRIQKRYEGQGHISKLINAGNGAVCNTESSIKADNRR